MSIKEILGKYKQPRQAITLVLAITLLCYQSYMVIFIPPHPILQKPLFLFISLMLGYLFFPANRNTKKKWHLVFDLGFFAIIIILSLHFIINTQRFQTRVLAISPMTTMDRVLAIALLITILELVRRVLGNNLLIFVIIFIAYASLGQKLPGVFRYSGMSFRAFCEMLLLSADGIMGIPLSTAADYIYYFLLLVLFSRSVAGKSYFWTLGSKWGTRVPVGLRKQRL
jgi:TRAP-type uncharacterized transport system fused permease subunit